MDAKKIALLTLTGLIAACGSDDNNSSNSAINGTWTGQVSVTRDCTSVLSPITDIEGMEHTFLVSTQVDPNDTDRLQVLASDKYGNSYLGHIDSEGTVLSNDNHDPVSIIGGEVPIDIETGFDFLEFVEVNDEVATISFGYSSDYRGCIDDYEGEFQKSE